MSLPLWVLRHTEPREEKEQMHLLPLPLIPRALTVSNGETPYGNHRSGDSMVASAVHDRASTDRVSMHTVVCFSVHFTAGRGAPRLCID